MKLLGVKLLFCFGTILTVANAGFLGGLHGSNGRSGDFGGRVKTIRVIQENGGFSPESASRSLDFPRGGEHVDTIRVIPNHGRSFNNAPSHLNGGGGTSIPTVRVIQEREPIASHSFDIGHPVGEGHVETIRLIHEPVQHDHSDINDRAVSGSQGFDAGPAVDGRVNTVRVIQERGPIGSSSNDVGRRFGGGPIETFRLIPEPFGQFHDFNHISNQGPIGSSTTGVGQSLGGGHVDTIRLIQEPVGNGISESRAPNRHIDSLNNDHIETIRVIHDDVVNNLRSGPIDSGHGGLVKTIRLIKHSGGLSQHNNEYSHNYNHEQAGHYPQEHAKIIHIIAASAGNDFRRY